MSKTKEEIVNKHWRKWCKEKRGIDHNEGLSAPPLHQEDIFYPAMDEYAALASQEHRGEVERLKARVKELEDLLRFDDCPESLIENPSFVLNAIGKEVSAETMEWARLVIKKDEEHREEWVRVEERELPEHEKVLVKIDDDTILLGICNSKKEWEIYWADGRTAEDPDRPVTHWMPLPTPPTK